MVIAVDGNAYLGKTTYLSTIMHINPERFIMVQEYDTDLDLLNCLSTHHERQEYYFSMEEKRVSRYGYITDKTLLLDRSYLSLLAHSWALGHLEQRPYFTDTLNLLYRQLNRGQVLIPDQYIFFLQKDYNCEYSDYLGKGSEDILYNYDYRLQIDKFFMFLAPALEGGFCPIDRMLDRLGRLDSEMEYKND